jgi:hypothetical protein
MERGAEITYITPRLAQQPTSQALASLPSPTILPRAESLIKLLLCSSSEPPGEHQLPTPWALNVVRHVAQATVPLVLWPTHLLLYQVSF